MSFLFPGILWGLFAVSIPVVIHLFNFRRFRRVYFTNVKYLAELKQQTRKQSQLRHLLVMISRMLAIAALVIAFSQPYVPHDKSSMRPDAVSQVNIYIDNSFSMEALSPVGPLLESARSKAKEIAGAYKSTDLFRLTTNDLEARHQRWVNQDEFLQMVDEINITPDVRALSEILARQEQSYYDSPGQQKFSYLISDFQNSINDFESIRADSAMQVRIVPIESVTSDNLFIDSCWFESPVHQLNQRVKLIVRVVNDSEINYEKVPLKLTINGKQKAMASFDVRPGTFIDVELPFTNYEEGIQYGVAEITDYPVVFDDRMFLVYNVAGSIPVLAINGGLESDYLNTLYGIDSAFYFVNNPLRNIDYNRLQDYELIILNELQDLSSGLVQELLNYLDNGGTVLVIPAADADLVSYRNFLSNAGSNYYSGMVNEATRVSELDRENQVFSEVFEGSGEQARSWENVDMPAVNSYYPISVLPGTAQISILSMLNGKPFLSYESAGKGSVFLLAVPLSDEYSNFARHALFVPALFRIALLSAATDPLYYTIGKDNRIELNNSFPAGDNVLKIINEAGDFEFIPGIQNLNRKLNLYVYDQINEAGHYKLMKGEDILKGLGFNYNRKESVMRFANKQEIEEKIRRNSLAGFEILADKGKPLTDTIKDMNQGTLLWKLFITLALVFLAIEIVLLRFWRLAK